MSSAYFYAFVVNKMHPNQLWLERFFASDTTTSRSAAVFYGGVIALPNSWSCARARAPRKACILHSKLTSVTLRIPNDNYNSSFLVCVPCVLDGVAIGLLDGSDLTHTLKGSTNKNQTVHIYIYIHNIYITNILANSSQVDPNLGHKWFTCMLTQACEIRSARCWQRHGW